MFLGISKNLPASSERGVQSVKDGREHTECLLSAHKPIRDAPDLTRNEHARDVTCHLSRYSRVFLSGICRSLCSFRRVAWLIVVLLVPRNKPNMAEQVHTSLLFVLQATNPPSDREGLPETAPFPKHQITRYESIFHIPNSSETHVRPTGDQKAASQLRTSDGTRTLGLVLRRPPRQSRAPISVWRECSTV